MCFPPQASFAGAWSTWLPVNTYAQNAGARFIAVPAADGSKSCSTALKWRAV